MAMVLAMRGRRQEGECAPCVKTNVDSRTSAENLGVIHVNGLDSSREVGMVKDEHGRLAA